MRKSAARSRQAACWRYLYKPSESNAFHEVVLVADKGTASVPSGGGALSQIENMCMSVASVFPIPHFKNWLSMFFHPVEAIEKDKANAGVGGVVVNAIIAGILYGIAYGIFLLLATAFSPLAGMGGIGSALMAVLVMIVICPIALVIGSFIGSGIYYIVAKILGGKGGYMVQTYGLTLITGGMIFLNSPLMILVAIPCIGLVFSLVSLVVSLYALYSQYKMIKAVHSLSSGKAAAVIIIPIVIAIVLAMVFAAVLVAIFGAALMSAAATSQSTYY